MSIFALIGAFPQISIAESIDNMWCQAAEGFNERMVNQGFRREITLPFGWGEFDDSISHNISGSQVDSYDKKARNRWVLYTKESGQWKIFQGVIRINLKTNIEQSFVCEVKSGSKLIRH